MEYPASSQYNGFLPVLLAEEFLYVLLLWLFFMQNTFNIHFFLLNIENYTTAVIANPTIAATINPAIKLLHHILAMQE